MTIMEIIGILTFVLAVDQAYPFLKNLYVSGMTFLASSAPYDFLKKFRNAPRTGAKTVPRKAMVKLKKILTENDCILHKQGKGDHEAWYSPVSEQYFIVNGIIKSRHTANETLKQAGLEQAF